MTSLKSLSLMSEKYTSNNIENDEPNLNNKDKDYETLITRLKEIRRTITLLEKLIDI